MIRIEIRAVAIDLNGLEQEIRIDVPVDSQCSESEKVSAVIDLSEVYVSFAPILGFKAF